MVAKRWDRVSKAYSVGLYATEALALITLFLFTFTREMFFGVTFIGSVVVTSTFHIMLQNYALHMKGTVVNQEGS